MQSISQISWSEYSEIHTSKGRIKDTIQNIFAVNLITAVKPLVRGLVKGFQKSTRKIQLEKAIKFAFTEGDELVLESFLKGRELTCAVFRANDTIKALPITEIISENDFFDYDAKYNGKSKEETPAKIDEVVANTIKSISQEIYDLLGLKSIARIDYILVESTPYVIEVNTITGFFKGQYRSTNVEY